MLICLKPLIAPLRRGLTASALTAQPARLLNVGTGIESVRRRTPDHYCAARGLCEGM